MKHDLLDTDEAAIYLRLDRSTLAKWRSAGVGPAYVKKNAYVRYDRTDLDEWIDRQKVRPA